MNLDRPFIFSGDTSKIHSIMKMGSDGFFVSAALDGSVKVWSSHDGTYKRALMLPQDKAEAIGIVNETSVYVVGKHSMAVWGVEDQLILAQSQTWFSLRVSCLILDSSTAVIVDVSGRLSKVQWKLGCINKLEEVMTHHEKNITNAFSDGDMIAICSDDSTISLWDASSLSYIRSFQGGGCSVSCVAFNNLYLVAGLLDSAIRVYNVSDSNILVDIVTHRKEVKALLFLKNSNILVSGGADNAIAFHELPSGTLLAKHFVENFCSFEQLDPRTLIVAENGYSVVPGPIIGVTQMVTPCRMRRIGIAHVLQEGTHVQLAENKSQLVPVPTQEVDVKQNSSGLDDLLELLRTRINDLELVQRDTASRMDEFEAWFKRSTLEFLNMLVKGPQ